MISATPETKRPSVLETTTTWGARLALLALVTLLAAALSLADGKKHKLSKDLDALKGSNLPRARSTSCPKTLTLSKAAIVARRLT